MDQKAVRDLPRDSAIKNGLEHHFFLLDRIEHPPARYHEFAGRVGTIHLRDDLLRYISDSLRWIPSTNPAQKRTGYGINLYGPTVIGFRGASVAHGVFESWARLFLNSPATLRLTGSWTEIEGRVGSGAYQTLQYRRDEVISKLRRLAILSRRVQQGAGACYILHLGI